MNEVCRHNDDREDRRVAEDQQNNLSDWVMDALMSEGRTCFPRVTAPGMGRGDGRVANAFSVVDTLNSDILDEGTFVIPPLDYGGSIRFSKQWRDHGGSIRFSEIEDLVRSMSARPLNMHHQAKAAEMLSPGIQESSQQVVQEIASSSVEEEAQAVRPASVQAKAPDNWFFISQLKHERFNPNGGSCEVNNDCGPTSLAMAARAFGRVDPSVPSDQLINDARFKMTGATNHGAITNYDQMVAGASKFGLNSRYISFSDLDSALARGEMVMFDGNPGNSYGNRMSQSEYAKYNGGHFMLVCARTANGYLIADPLSKVGLFEISPKEMWDFANWGKGSAGLALSA